MTPQEKEIRARESATAYVRGTSDKDRTALIALLDKERAKSAAMLAALKAARREIHNPGACASTGEDIAETLDAVIRSAEGR